MRRGRHFDALCAISRACIGGNIVCRFLIVRRGGTTQRGILLGQYGRDTNPGDTYGGAHTHGTAERHTLPGIRQQRRQRKILLRNIRSHLITRRLIAGRLIAGCRRCIRRRDNHFRSPSHFFFGKSVAVFRKTIIKTVV